MTVRRDERWSEHDGWRIPAVSDRDHQALADHAHSPETARRFRIVLLTLEGWPDAAIAEHLGISIRTVTWWKGQFAKEGIAGLLDQSTTRRVSTSQPSAGRPRTAGQPRGDWDVVDTLARKDRDDAGSRFGAASEIAEQANTAAMSAARPRRDRRVAAARSGWTLDVEPRMAVSTVELIGAFVSPQVQVGGLLEVPEPDLPSGRRTRHAAPPQQPVEDAATEDVGTLRWLSGSQPVAHQLRDFLREALGAAPGRRLHVVTADPAAFTWLRTLRSRDTRTNLVAHLAVDSRAWLDLMDVWPRGKTTPTARRSVRPFDASTGGGDGSAG